MSQNDVYEAMLEIKDWVTTNFLFHHFEGKQTKTRISCNLRKLRRRGLVVASPIETNKREFILREVLENDPKKNKYGY